MGADGWTGGAGFQGTRERGATTLEDFAESALARTGEGPAAAGTAPKTHGPPRPGRARTEEA